MIDERTQHLRALDTAVRAVCPIDGLFIRPDGTVRLDFADSATPKQRSDGQAAVAAFDWNAEKDKPEVKLDGVGMETKILAALVRKAKHDQLGTPYPQWVANVLTRANQKLSDLGIP